MRIYDTGRKEWAEWDRFNSSCDSGNVFQSLDFAEALESSDMRVGLIIARGDDGKIEGGAFYYLPFKGGIKAMFNRFFVTSGPVLRDIDDKKTLGLFLDVISRRAEECRASNVELRTPFVRHRETMAKHGYVSDDCTSASFITKLTSKEAAWKGLKKKTRNAVRKAEKVGVTVRDASSAEDIEIMHKLHLARAKDISGWIPLSQAFFEGMWKMFSGSRKAKFMIAEHEGKPVAESIFICYRDRVHYFSNASLKEYQHLNPNSLLVWRAVEWAIKNGFKVLDLYGTPCSDDKSHPQYGLYKFKSGFGGELVKEMQYYRRIVSGRKNTLFEKFIRPVVLPIYKKMGHRP